MNESPVRLADKETNRSRQAVADSKWNAGRMRESIELAIRHGDGDEMRLRQALMHLEIADMLATKALLGDVKE